MRLAEAYGKEQIEQIRQLYEAAFPASEKKPFSLMLEKREQGWMEILSIESEEGIFSGLAIAILYRDVVLLDYFAIAENMRGQGVGTQALHIIKERYKEKRLVLEIESTFRESENREQRLTRKGFYLRSGMTVMPYLVQLFGVEMEVLTCPAPVSYEEYFAVYENAFGEEKLRRVILENVKKISE